MTEFTFTEILEKTSVLDYAAQKLITIDPKVLPTGFPDWDAACDETGKRGLGDYWYILLGGASNSGKTQLLRWLARRACDEGYYPAVITMEVSVQGLQRHYYSDITSFGYYDLLPHKFAEHEDSVESVKQLAKEVHDYRMADGLPRSITVVEAVGRPSIDEIEAQAYALKEAGVTHLFVDHAQLIKSPHYMSIAESAEELSERMRIFAHTEHVCTVMASQLNRSASAQRKERPTMHSLLGGTSMESNANQVCLLDHSRNSRDPEHPHLLRTWLLLDKNREGPARVEIPVEVNFQTGLWRQADEDEVSDGKWAE